MGVLDELLAIHKKTVLVGGNGFAVNCGIKPPANKDFFEMTGFSTFVGVTFDNNGVGYFGDSFELTLDVNDVREQTKLIPIKGWDVFVAFPQMNGEKVNFKIESVATDRTLGMYLIKCSCSGSYGGMKVKRQLSGGM